MDPNVIIDFILDVLEQYVKSTPRRWDDAVFALVKALLKNERFLELLKQHAEQRGLAVAFPPQ